MDHLNVFNNFESHKINHEDVLTRAYLIVLKLIPNVFNNFIKIIRANYKNDLKQDILEFAIKDVQVFTQVDNNNNLFELNKGKTIISILLTDEYLENFEHDVQGSDRHARYDGVIVTDKNILIIENKPYHGDVWKEQLNPNFKNIENNNILGKPCVLSWREIIDDLSNNIDNYSLNALEKEIVNEFLEYVNENYIWLNPYNKFYKCKNDQYLLNRHCFELLKQAYPKCEARHHNGWKDCVIFNSNYFKEIALDSEVKDNNDWTINLWVYIGNIMSRARLVYQDLKYEELKKLLEIDKGFLCKSDFHLAKQNDNVFWFNINTTPLGFVHYWTKHSINQLHKKDFISFFDNGVKENIIIEKDREDYINKIVSKKYQKLNVCPGFLLKYVWTSEKSKELESNGCFIDDIKSKIESIINIFR